MIRDQAALDLAQMVRVGGGQVAGGGSARPSRCKGAQPPAPVVAATRRGAAARHSPGRGVVTAVHGARRCAGLHRLAGSTLRRYRDEVWLVPEGACAPPAAAWTGMAGLCCWGPAWLVRRRLAPAVSTRSVGNMAGATGISSRGSALQACRSFRPPIVQGPGTGMRDSTMAAGLRAAGSD